MDGTDAKFWDELAVATRHPGTLTTCGRCDREGYAGTYVSFHLDSDRDRACTFTPGLTR